MWKYGSWKHEPDFVEFEHAGLECVLHRGGGGVWCGYVAVPPGHSCYGMSHGEATVLVEVHEGLSSSGSLCHPTSHGDVWWLGFACQGLDDLVPANGRTTMSEHYWTVKEVRKETEKLAEQLAALS